jgi:hypothetical protein
MTGSISPVFDAGTFLGSPGFWATLNGFFLFVRSWLYLLWLSALLTSLEVMSTI